MIGDVFNNERIVIILGYLTLTLALTIFASCRSCLVGLKRVGLSRALDSPPYRVFYRFHRYYWWLFGVFVLSHAVQALLHTGFPQSGDPDAGAHWFILGAGSAGIVAAAITFGSCRLSLPLARMLTLSRLAASRAFRAYFRPHSYYWLLFGALAGAHLALGLRHAGIWPA